MRKQNRDGSGEIWMMSNRQPWVWALVNGLITCKTRSENVTLPPVGATVYLHASQGNWQGYRDLWWYLDYDIPRIDEMEHGGICGVAVVASVGETLLVMPLEDQRYFSGNAPLQFAGPQTIVFRDIKKTPFIKCRGAQVPTRVLPPELRAYLERGARRRK